MRVTGGKLGGRRLIAPDDARVRPTSDRTRQAIFNILEHRDFNIGFAVENAAVVDLFAGTGALGIEAVSRGARFCLLVDDSAESRALQRENVEALGLTGVTKIWAARRHRSGTAGRGRKRSVRSGFSGPALSQESDRARAEKSARGRLADKAGFADRRNFQRRSLRGGWFRTAGRARLRRNRNLFPNAGQIGVRCPPASTPHRWGGRDCTGRNGASLPSRATARSSPRH